MDILIGYLALDYFELSVVSALAIVAGIVRGFTGFGLSAVLMASAIFVIPPLALIPLCFLLEALASAAMLKKGRIDANMSVVWGLSLSSFAGMPLGLFALNTLDAEHAKITALALILTLSCLQLFNVRPAFLATKSGLYVSGFAAGVATGLASVGGMVVALYVLASNEPALRMRASLVMFLLIGVLGSSIFMILYNMIGLQEIFRAVFLSPFVLLGIWGGSQLFNPRWQAIYKPACLTFLLILCLIGLLRTYFEYG